MISFRATLHREDNTDDENDMFRKGFFRDGPSMIMKLMIMMLIMTLMMMMMKLLIMMIIMTYSGRSSCRATPSAG